MNIFGGNTGITYEQLQARRKMVDQLRAQNTRTPQNVGEGIHAIARALVSRGVDKQNTAKTEELRKQYEGMFSGLMGGGQTGTSFNPAASMPSTPPAPNDPAVIGADTMAALGEGSRGPVSADVVRAGLVKRGLPEHVADAFVLNFQDESGLNPNINETNPTVPGSRGGFGLAQWTGPRRVALEQFAKQTGRPINSVDTQLDFLMTELQGPESKAANAILSTRGTPDAAAAVVNQFLRPAEEHRARREAQYTGGGVRTADAGSISPSIAQLAQILSAPDEFVPPGQKAVAQALLQQQLAAGQPMSPLEQAQLAKIQAETARLSGQGPQDETEYGLTPQYATDAEGNLKMVVIGKNGTAKEVDLPDGLALQRGLEKMDMGTHFQWFNKMTGEAVGQAIPKNIREAASEAAAGAAEGKSEVEKANAAPAAIAMADESLALIDDVMNDPALDSALGPLQGRLDPEGLEGLVMNKDQRRIVPKINQVKGKAFLDAFERLKGGGQITEKEGQAALEASARLQRYQEPEDFKAALLELRNAVLRGKLRAMGVDVPEFADPSQYMQGAGAATGAAQTFEQFAADPSAQAAAKQYGVTLEEMWEIKRSR